MRKLIAVGALASLTFVTPLAAQEDPAALVIRLQGDVSVTHGGASPAPAALGERMFVGDGVLPASGAQAVLMTRTGASQIVTQQTMVAEPRGAGNPDIFARAMRVFAQAADADEDIGLRQGMIRPITGETVLVGPRRDLAVSDGRPTFVWTSTPGSSYDLMIRKSEGGRPMIFEVGPDTTWTYPDDEPELEAGADYKWTVFVGGRRGGRPLPEDSFRVISLVESVELEDYMEEISVFGLDPMTDGLFLTVIALRDMELFYDARDALDEVESQASLSADLYQLKGEILAELGHGEAAREAFDRADELSR